MKEGKQSDGMGSSVKSRLKRQVKSLVLAITSCVILFLLFGAVTAVIPNTLFTRMTPVTWLEYASLVLTSLLLGAYIGLSSYAVAARARRCNATAAAGGVSGFMTFGCSICNKLLVLLLGVTGVLSYFEPIRSAFGFMSIGLLGWAVLYRLRQIKK